MRRRVLHAILVLVLGTVPLVLGVMAALIWTGPGRDLLGHGFVHASTKGQLIDLERLTDSR
jgi:hypothetical protein